MQKSKQTPPWFKTANNHWQNKQAIIIGGGIAGAQSAWHLCQADWQVTLIERHNALATEASGNPAGVISPKMTAHPSLGEDFYTQAYHYTLEQLKTLQQQGHVIDWEACGVLQLTHNSREEKRWHALKKRNLESGFIQLLDENETERVAGIKLHAQQTYKSSYFPKGGWIKPSSYAKALVNHPNCQIIKNTEAILLKKSAEAWQILSQDNHCIAQSEVVIIANGKDLFNFEQSRFLVGMPVAGQTTLAGASNFSKKLNTVIGHEGYLTPAINAKHVFGATFERDINEATVKQSSNTENLHSLQQYLPEFALSLQETSSAHCAVRMTTPDRFPYVGALPDTAFYQKNYHDLHQGKHYKQYPAAQYQKGLFVLGGLGSRGLISSGLCAQALTESLLNKPLSKASKQLLKNCHPARFLIKVLKQKQGIL